VFARDIEDQYARTAARVILHEIRSKIVAGCKRYRRSILQYPVPVVGTDLQYDRELTAWEIVDRNARYMSQIVLAQPRPQP